MCLTFSSLTQAITQHWVIALKQKVHTSLANSLWICSRDSIHVYCKDLTCAHVRAHSHIYTHTQRERGSEREKHLSGYRNLARFQSLAGKYLAFLSSVMHFLLAEDKDICLENFSCQKSCCCIRGLIFTFLPILGLWGSLKCFLYLVSVNYMSLYSFI